MTAPAGSSDKLKKGHFFLFLLFDITFLIIYRTICSYTDSGDADLSTPSINSTVYLYYTHIFAMTIIGYGYFFTFGRRGSLAAVFYSLAISAVALQWGLLVVEFWYRVNSDNWTRNYHFEVIHLIKACYPTVAVLITASVVLGKVSYIQMVWILSVEIIAYGVNQYVLLYQLNIPAYDNHLFVFAFGGFYGLGLLAFFNKKFSVEYEKRKVPTTTTNLTSLIGALFLFAFFPSFNAALNPQALQNQVIVNTYLSMAAAAFAAYSFSVILNNGRFDATEVRNGAIAGGIVMSSGMATMDGPAVGTGVGFVAGSFVVIFIKFVGKGASSSAVRDTSDSLCLNLVASLIAAVGTFISVSVSDASNGFYGSEFSHFYPSDDKAAANQVAAYFITMGISLVTGVFTGIIFSCATFHARDESEALDGADYIVAYEPEKQYVAPVAAPRELPKPVVVATTVVAPPAPQITRAILGRYDTPQVANWLNSVGVSQEYVSRAFNDGLIGEDILSSEQQRLNEYFNPINGKKVWDAVAALPPGY